MGCLFSSSNSQTIPSQPREPNEVPISNKGKNKHSINMANRKSNNNNSPHISIPIRETNNVDGETVFSMI